MSTTYADDFYGTNWERYATVVAKFSPVALVLVFALSHYFHDFGHFTTHSIYTLLVAILIAVIEFQALWCFSQLDELRNKVYDFLHLKSYLSKSISFAILSLYFYFGTYFDSLAGIYLDITSLLFLFAWLNVRHDQQTMNLPISSFGTF